MIQFCKRRMKCSSKIIRKKMKGPDEEILWQPLSFLMVYEVVSIVRRKKQIMYQYFAIVLITMLLSQIDGKYIEYVLLFSILILGTECCQGL